MGHDELFGVILSELLPSARGLPFSTNFLFKRGICMSGCRDLNWGPSVPQIDAPQTADLRIRRETASGLPF